MFGLEYMFLIGVRILSGTVTARQAGEAFARLADAVIRALHRSVSDNFAMAHGHMRGEEAAVVALGKLGGYEMTATSDLDLILIYDFDDRYPESDGPRPLYGAQYFARLTQRLINLLSPDERRVAVRLLGYPEESIGRRMTPDYVAIRQDWTISHVFSHLRQVGKDKETLNVVFVTDERGHLIDDIRLRDLVMADPNDMVSDIMDGHYAFLRANDDQEEAVRAFKKYDRSALPVVDSSNTLVGIVTIDDVLDVAEREETEDIQKMAAVEALDAPYLTTDFWIMVKKRAGWLLALFLGALLTATAMGYFQKEIAQAVVLAMFMPLIISSGGNAGSQGSSLIIRALAVGEVTLADWWRIMRREVMSGVALGSILGIVAFSRIVFWPWRLQMYGPHYPWVAFAVGTSLVGVVMWGTLSGSMLPLILRRLGFDPAVSSAPFVATLVDVTGLVIYFMTAKVILHGTLL
jgi:magnesium transporter